MKKINTDLIPAEAFDKMKAKAANRPDPINNKALVADWRAEGGQVLHIRPRNGRRGMTAAFKVLSGHIQLATAVQHRSDDFTKKIGTKLAIEHFKAGKVITIPLRSGGKPTMGLKTALSILC